MRAVGEVPAPASHEPHGQPTYRVRLDWGPSGAAAVAAGADVAVVVDVLSFTTTLTVALERGVTVFPYRWQDDGAAAYAAARDAVLAVGRFEAAGRGGDPDVTLSPAAMARVAGVERVVLPSPNGSTICFELAARGLEVVGASLRNAAAVGRWLAPRVAAGATVAVVAAGERWPDGSLRPCAEDLWGAGAVLAGLIAAPAGEPDAGLGAGLGAGLRADLDAGLGLDLSPEARLALRAYEAVRPTLAEDLLACAGGRELAAGGFADDVRVAGRLDASTVVPALDGEAFRPAARGA